VNAAAGAEPAPHRVLAGWAQRLRQRAFRVSPADREPIVLRHSRIYILPTRRGYAFIATLITMLLTSLNYALSLGLAVTFLLAGLVAASLLHTFRNLSGIEIKPLAGGDAFVGEHLAFSLSLAAGAMARIAVNVSAAGATTRNSVEAGAARTVTIDVPATARGRIALGRVTLSSEYPLGLWRGWAYVHFPLSAIAYPAPEALAPPLPVGAQGVEALVAGRSGDADLAGLREYQRGDPLQRIAWKAVARGAGWFSKSFEGTGAHGPVALAWGRLPPQLDTEQRASRLAAWVLAAERATRPFSLSIPGTTLPPGSGREHRRAALTALALIPPGAR
jgi:uncharacterized protein (DUF58 family)